MGEATSSPLDARWRGHGAPARASTTDGRRRGCPAGATWPRPSARRFGTPRPLSPYLPLSDLALLALADAPSNRALGPRGRKPKLRAPPWQPQHGHARSAWGWTTATSSSMRRRRPLPPPQLRRFRFGQVWSHPSRPRRRTRLPARTMTLYALWLFLEPQAGAWCVCRSGLAANALQKTLDYA